MTDEAPAPLRASTTRHTNHARRRRLVKWIKRGALAMLGIGIVGAVIYAWLPAPVVVDTVPSHLFTNDVDLCS